MTVLFRSALICSALAMVGCEIAGEEDLAGEEGLVGDEPAVWAEEALGPIEVASSTPLGLAASATHLYWTTFDVDPLGAMTAVVWATAKGSSPGDEIPIYTRFEPAGTASFHVLENLAIPVSGGSDLFFVSNDSDDGNTGSMILRMSQAGGPVTLIGATDYMGDRPLVTDGTRVFWSDPGSIFRVLAAGGPVAVLLPQPSPVLGVSGTYVYYTAGAAIRRTQWSGGGGYLSVAIASAPVTALYVQPGSGTVFWGEQGGAVRSVPAAGTPVTTYQAPIAGRTVTSVGNGSSRVLWIDCLSNGSDCAVKVFQGGATTAVAAGATGAGHLQWDATSVFWGQDGGLMKYVF